MSKSQDKSKTQRAKNLWQSLYNEKHIAIDFIGLIGDIWVSRGNRAYKLDELSNEHLINIMAKYREKGESVPKAISDAYYKMKGR